MDRVSLMYKVLSDEANPQEQRALRRWLQESAANRQEFDDIRLLRISELMSQADRQEDEEGYDAIISRMKRYTRGKRRRRTMLSVLLTLVLGLLLVYFLREAWLTPKDSENRLPSFLYGMRIQPSGVLSPLGDTDVVVGS